MTVKRPNGFTFIELMVALVVLGVFAGLVIPRLSGRLAEESMDGSVRAFTAFSRYVVSKAHGQARPFWIVVEDNGRSYWFEEETQNTKQFPQSLPEGIFIKTPLKRIAVYPDGSVDAADLIFTGQDGKSTRKVTSRLHFGEFALEA